MTTIVAAKCSDGIVIACDSQASSEDEGTKKTDVNKIIPINDQTGQPNLMLAASGSVDDITLLKEALTKAAQYRQYKKESDIRGEMDRISRELFKEQNVKRAKEMGFDGPARLWKPDSVLAIRFPQPDKAGQSFGLYHLRHDGVSIPVEKYHTLGSGGPFADFLLNMNERLLPIVDPEYKGMPLHAMTISLMMVINQVKTTDLYSGGPVRLAVVSKDGAAEFSVKEILELQKTIIEAAESKFAKGTEIEQVIFKVLRVLIGGAF